MTDKQNNTLCLTNRIMAEIVDKAIKEDKIAPSRAALLQAALVLYLEDLGYEVNLPKRKISEDQRIEIVKRYIPRVNGTELAAEFGITLDHLVQVIRRAKVKEDKENGRNATKAKSAQEKTSGKQANQKAN